MAKNKENGDFTNQNAFEDAVSYFKRGFEILTQEANRVREEKEAFDSVSKKLNEGHFGKTVRLNIGGQYFTTSVHTLTKDPGSMLNAMFSGRFETQPSEDGSFFIDRDGTYFRFILNYLRTGKLLLPKDELVRIRDELLAEAEYYQIEGIVDELTPKAEPKFHESVILNSEQADTLVNWLPPEDSELGEVVLLYWATRDGWESTKFHRLCDFKGPTITVVKVGTNVFGGYTEQSVQFIIFRSNLVLAVDKIVSDSFPGCLAADSYWYGFGLVQSKKLCGKKNHATLSGPLIEITFVGDKPTPRGKIFRPCRLRVVGSKLP